MKIIFVFAHPDDETLSSGGTIALLSKENEVKLICATKGEAGQVGEPPVCAKENLAKVREEELRRAAKTLGISEIFFLGFIDGMLHKIQKKKLADPIYSILLKEKPDMVITFDEQGGSNHPDHKAINKAATTAFNEFINTVNKPTKLYYTAMPRSYIKAYEKLSLSYTAFGRIKGTPDKIINTIVDISKTFNLKEAALREHKTQHKDVKRFLKRVDHVNLKKEFFRLIKGNSII